MRILIYGLNFAPEVTGVGRYTSELAAQLIVQGHEVKIVTSYPYYPHWRIASGCRSWTYKHDTFHGADVLRCPIWVPRNPTMIKRLFHLLSFSFATFIPLQIIALSFKPQVVWTVEPTSLGLPAALLSARITNAASWLHVQDIEASAVASLNKTAQGRVERAGRCIYTYLLRSFNCVSTISETMKHELAFRFGLEHNMINLLRNWVDTQHIAPLSDVNRLKDELGLNDGSLICLYSGNIGEKQGVESLVDAARTLRDHDNIRFVFCGDGAAKERVVARSTGLSNVIILPLQPEERLNELMNLADVHLLPQKDGANTYSMPSKLAGMLASGRPIVAQAVAKSELAEIVANCGIVVPPNDGYATATAVKRLMIDASARRIYGANARSKAILMFSASAMIERFCTYLQELETTDSIKRDVSIGKYSAHV